MGWCLTSGRIRLGNWESTEPLPCVFSDSLAFVTGELLEPPFENGVHFPNYFTQCRSGATLPLIGFIVVMCPVSVVPCVDGVFYGWRSGLAGGVYEWGSAYRRQDRWFFGRSLRFLYEFADLRRPRNTA